MINIYTSTNYFDKKDIVINNESFFKNNITAKSFGILSIQVLKDIDSAELLDRDNGKIETPYGLAGLWDLSTGCKTALNLIFLLENPFIYPNVKAINATECGWNAIDKLFDIIEEKKDYHISIIIEHENELYKCRDRQYRIDGDRIIESLLDL